MRFVRCIFQWVWIFGSVYSSLCLHDGRYYDELLWSKSSWNEYKLIFPLHKVHSMLDSSSRQSLESILDLDFMKSFPHGADTAKQNFEVRSELLPLGLENSRSLSTLVECDVQTALSEVLWPVIANWTLSYALQLDDHQLGELLSEACDVEVPVLVLKDEALALVTVEKGSDSLETGEHENEKTSLHTSYAVSLSRQSQHASQSEMAAVSVGCNRAAGKKWRQSMFKAQQMYLKVVRRILGPNGMGISGGNPGKEVVETTVKLPEGVHLDRSCVDYHPQCQLWADKGECNANPTYMVGSSETGQCRLACGVCRAGLFQGIPVYLSASNAQLLEDTYSDSLLFLLSTLDSCDVEGQKRELDELLRSHGSVHARSLADQMNAAVYLGTSRLAESADEKSIIVAHEVDAETPTKVIIGTHADAVVPITKIVKDVPDAERTVDDKQDDHEPYDSTEVRDTMSAADDHKLPARIVLDEILHDRCIYADTGGYWTYQFCYGLGVVQFHEEEEEEYTHSIDLGHFAQASSSWKIQTGQGNIKYVLHEYSDGAECAETGEARKTIVRYLCSDSNEAPAAGSSPPNPLVTVTVTEPELCVYRLDIWLKDLLCEEL
jgi:hypothetical protein